MNKEHEELSLIEALTERLSNGLLKENPTFVLMLGMCPTLAVTTSAINGLGMGVSTLVVLAMSNLIISLLRKIIPNKIRIPAFIVIIASFVTMVELLMKGYIPSLYSALGIYIPLIVVNCIILGRAESYAYSHGPLLSLFDGLGMGMGFTLALTIIGALREILGSGKVFDQTIMPDGFVPVSIFVMAPGAFFVLALLTAIQNKVKEIGEKHGKDMSKIQSGCGGNCLACDKECKVEMTAEPAEAEVRDNSSEETEDNDQIKQDDGSEEPGDEKAEDEHSEKHVSVSLFAKGLRDRFGKKRKAAEPDGDESGEKPEEPGEESGDDTLVDGKVDEEPAEGDREPVGESEQEQEEPESSEGQSEEEQQEPGDGQDEPVKEPEEPEQKQEEPVKEPENVPEVKAESTEKSEVIDEEVELWDISDYRKAIKRELPSGKRPSKKKKAMEKAQAMLIKAEDTEREDNND